MDHAHASSPPDTFKKLWLSKKMSHQVPLTSTPVPSNTPPPPPTSFPKRIDFSLTSTWKRERATPPFVGPAGSMTFMEDEESSASTSRLHTPSTSSSTPSHVQQPSSATSSIFFSSPSTPRDRLSVIPSPTQSRLEQDFFVLDTLGQGNFGSVVKAQHKVDQCLYAVKIIKRTRRKGRALEMKELRAHCALNSCPNIIQYFTSWFDSGECLHVQLELCETNLLQRRRLLPQPLELSVLSICRDISSALLYMHTRNFVHLDCKLENMLLGIDGTWKLGDLGHCTELSPDTGLPLTEVLDGDFTYMSMEVVNDDYDWLKRADVFALGISMYELFLPTNMALPGKGDEWTKVRQGSLRREATAQMSPQCERLLRWMMLEQVERRADVIEVVDALAQML